MAVEPRRSFAVAPAEPSVVTAVAIKLVDGDVAVGAGTAPTATRLVVAGRALRCLLLVVVLNFLLGERFH